MNLLPGVLFALVFVPMVVEAWLSGRNERALRARGACEPEGDVIRRMQIGYPAAFLAMIAESQWRESGFDRVFFAGVALFLGSKALKYWAIGALGERWTFRVLVPPRSSRVETGPYRLMNHPNYAAVVAELASVAVMARAWVTGPAATLFFFLLIRKRIAIEERALHIAQ